MEPINPLDALAELIRRRATESNKADKSLANRLTHTNHKHTVTRHQTAESVKLKIIEAIRNIDKSDKRKNQKSVHIFVENILLWQFGDELINDPSFSQLVTDVRDAMLKDPDIAHQIVQLE